MIADNSVSMCSFEIAKKPRKGQLYFPTRYSYNIILTSVSPFALNYLYVSDILHEILEVHVRVWDTSQSYAMRNVCHKIGPKKPSDVNTLHRWT